MLQPMKWIGKYKILSSFFEYLYKKNNYIRGKDEKKEAAYAYGQKHCNICQIIANANILQIEGLRKEFAIKDRKDSCFNAFNLASLRACKLPLNTFDTV